MPYVRAGPIRPASQPVADALKGRKLPFAGRVEMSIMEEGQSRWRGFLNRELDFLDILPISFTAQSIANGQPKPKRAAQGIAHAVLLRPNTWWTYVNMT